MNVVYDSPHRACALRFLDGLRLMGADVKGEKIDPVDETNECADVNGIQLVQN